MYFRLTYIASSDKDKRGDVFLNGNKPLAIGQGAACDVQLPDPGLYEPQVFVSILPKESDNGWLLVKRTDCCSVKVNGQEVRIAKALNQGDVLALSDDTVDEKFRFEVLDDGEFDGTRGFVYKRHHGNRHFMAVSIILSLLAVGVAAYSMLVSNRKDLRHIDLSRYSSSIYQVTVDSVYLVCDSMMDGSNRPQIVESIELQQAFVGTAFLSVDIKTGDTLFVTARHCVEPWINDEQWDGVSDSARMSPEVRLAIMAETCNRYAGYDQYKLKAHCVLSKGLERHEYYSTDFFMNKSRDLVLRLGTPDKALYWRTIIPIAHRRDMELGDFAYVKVQHLNRSDAVALVALADRDEMASLTQSGDRDVAVMGFPINDNDANKATVVYGNYMDLEVNDSIQTLDGCLKLSASINRGNSGGPVFALVGNEMRVIGIVSKADGRADQGLFWAVPVTEVTYMHRQGDKIEEIETFRR